MLSVCDRAVIFDDSCLPKANKSRVHLSRRVQHLRLSGWLAARIQDIGVIVSVIDGTCQILIGCVQAAECHIFIL